MTLLSRIIKSQYDLTKKTAKVIQVKKLASDYEQELLNDELIQEELTKKEFLKKYEEEAILLLNEARAEAEDIRDQILQEKGHWINEKQQWIEQAKKEGYEEGQMLGRQQGFEEYKKLMDQANSIVESSKEEFIHKLEQSEKVILDLGIKAAEKILNNSINENPELFLSIVRQLIKEAKEFKAIQIHIHPSRHQLVSSYKKEIDALLWNNAECYIYANEDLMENQCILESNNGRIDASIDSQLVELKKKLLELIEADKYGDS
jgi:flagellar assembly protein FliH